MRYDGIVRYAPELEDQLDVREHIVEFLNRRSGRLGWGVVAGELYSPLDVPAPS